ncbi:hypothetical protein H1R20_g7125, partial [Candolleomyces eurysporus]
MGLAFIERAGRQPLSVYLSSQRKKMGEKKLVKFSDTLNKSLINWSQVTVEETSHKRMALLVYALFCSRSWTINLTKLVLIQHSEKALKDKYFTCLAHVFDVRGLRVSELSEARFWKTPVVWANIRASSLAVLDIRYVTKPFLPAWTGFTEIIKAASNLQHLILIDVEFDLPSYRMPYPPLQVPNLKSLTVRVYNEDDEHHITPTFLKAIKQAPKLESLAVSDISELEQLAKAVFNSKDKFPELSSLSLLYVGCSTSAPVEFFQAAPEVKFFRFVPSIRGGCATIFDTVLEKNVWTELEKIVVVATRQNVPPHNMTEKQKSSIERLVENRKAAGQDIQVVEVDEEGAIAGWSEHEGPEYGLERPEDMFGDRLKRTWRMVDVLSDSDMDSE